MKEKILKSSWLSTGLLATGLLTSVLGFTSAGVHAQNFTCQVQGDENEVSCLEVVLPRTGEIKVTVETVKAINVNDGNTSDVEVSGFAFLSSQVITQTMATTVSSQIVNNGSVSSNPFNHLKVMPIASEDDFFSLKTFQVVSVGESANIPVAPDATRFYVYLHFIEHDSSTSDEHFIGKIVEFPMNTSLFDEDKVFTIEESRGSILEVKLSFEAEAFDFGM